MPSSEQVGADRKKYAKISLKKRQTLVESVLEQKQSLTRTAKKLNIKLSTAKLILRKYRKTGAFFVKNMGTRSGRKPNPSPCEASLGSVVNSGEAVVEEGGQSECTAAKVGFAKPAAELPVQPVFYPVDYSWLFYPWNLMQYSMPM